MIKVFISQPMRGKSDEEILRERAEVVARLKNAYGDDKITVLDSFYPNFNGKPLEFLAKSIAVLAQADVAYFCKGWEKARGCAIEHECAEKYGLDIREGDRLTEVMTC